MGRSMDLQQLEQFVAVAEERNFTRAAVRCRMAQSALSTSIRALEHDLGAPLFIRTTRRVELSETGQALLPEAQRVLDAAAMARDVVDQSVGRVRGNIAVGLVWGSICPVLSVYHRAYPDVSIALRQGLSVTLVDDVLRGDLDLAFVGLPPSGWPPGIRVISTRSVPVGIACADSHKLAREGRLELGQLAGEVFLAQPGDVYSYNAVTKFLAQAGVEYRTIFRVDDIPSMLDLVANGLAIALLPQAAVDSQPGIAYVPLARFSPTCISAVITADRPTSAATHGFIDTLEGLGFQL
jgi:DNA-binding transcriptional LysR family regulator